MCTDGETECHAYPFAPTLSLPLFRSHSFALISSLALLLLCAVSSFAQSVPWDANAQGQFITCLCRDLTGRVWVGTEDGQGLWSYDPAAKDWTHFPASPDLSGDIYAVACDKAGRIWAGGLSGVSVYNGRQWRQYGLTEGPLGTRLFALAVNPNNGDVWGATEAGLFRYAHSHWTYFTRADGLPSDQANALAIDKSGTLYVGTQCDGIAIGSPSDNYKTWRVVSGPRQLPNVPTGPGLPSRLINCLYVMRDGTVYAGTPCGIAASRDHGKTWKFRRGADWKDKLAGLEAPVPPKERFIQGDLLSEDYVTSLAEDEAGWLWIGHRAKGIEFFDRDFGRELPMNVGHVAEDGDATCLLPGGPGSWVGVYGTGLHTPRLSEIAALPLASSSLRDALPLPAAPPTVAELAAMMARVNSLHAKIPVGGGVYLGQDWRTQGDWVGHYGRQYGLLCSVASPLDELFVREPTYGIEGSLGPHIQDKDLLRHFMSYMKTDNPKTLYGPIGGYRTQSEWDDHGETYPRTFEGPDVWVTVTVPQGVYKVSLYDFNKDGHGDENRLRDYTVDLLPYRDDIEDAENLPPLAHARTRDFWNPLYQSFLVRGPSKYYLRVAKNNSLNVILSGVFIDKVAAPPTWGDKLPMAFMGIIHFDPPDLTNTSLPASANTPPMVAAQALWSALDAAQTDLGDSALLVPYRMLALRAAQASGGSAPLLANWRWNLDIWVDDDRQTFLNYMHAANATLQNSQDSPQ